MYKILDADDHNIVRSGIKSLIKENFGSSKVDEAADENQIGKLVKEFSYDLLMLDIIMANTDFVRLMDWLQVASPDTKILVLTMHPEDIYGLRSLQLGAQGFLRKTASDLEIISAIRTVLDGKKYINPVLAEILSQNAGGRSLQNPFETLSARELEIALLLDKGESLPNICSTLSIQYSTANTYKRRIFEKLNVHSILSLSRLMQTFNVKG